MESVKRSADSSAGECNALEKETKILKYKESDGITPDSHLFQGFEVVKVLNGNSQRKMMCFEGRYLGKEDKKAVVIVEKTPFDECVAKQILTDGLEAETNFHNDIYRSCQVYPAPQLNGIKTTLIYPATDKHITKYTAQEVFLIEETAEDYKNITLPYINSTSFSIQWVYNILEKKKESERIVYEDADPENGFILLPDLKWNTEQLEDLYLVAIVQKHGIKSIRELDASHLPLLRNIHTKGLEAIKNKYGIDKCKLRIYLHYQPSYYHLHVHFTHLKYDAPGSSVEKAHLLTDVINNINLMSDYYQKTSLTFLAGATDELYAKFKEASRV